MIDSYLRSQSELDDHVIHLLFSANRWELAYADSSFTFFSNIHVPFSSFRSTITNLLKSGTLVLCDRYAFSGIAFSAAKHSLRGTFPSTHGDALPWCRAPDISLPAPDLTIFLDITPEHAKLRGGYGEERYEKEELQKGVREMFYRLEEEMASPEDDVDGNSVGRWIVVDAGRERKTIAQELWQLVEPLTKGIDGDVARLWEDKLCSWLSAESSTAHKRSCNKEIYWHSWGAIPNTPGRRKFGASGSLLRCIAANCCARLLKPGWEQRRQ